MVDLEQIMEIKLEEAELLHSQLQIYERELVKKAMELAKENEIKINYLHPNSIIPNDPNSVNIFIDLNGNVTDHSELLFLASGLYSDLFTTYQLCKTASQQKDEELKKYYSAN